MSTRAAVRNGPHPIDIHVGSRVRLRRTLLGMSQEKLGQAVDVSFQQIQKYERGANRLASSRLYQFARALDVPVSFFFDGLDDDEGEAVAASSAGVPRESLVMMSHYQTLPREQRDSIRRLVATLARGPGAVADEEEGA